MTYGRLLISVVVVPPVSVDQTLRHRPLQRFPQIQYCAVKELAAARFELLPTFRAPHFSIELALADDLTISVFTDILSNEMENPHADH